MISRFELLNKDRIVIEFEFSRDEIGKVNVSETWRSDTEPLPIGYTNIRNWLTRRMAPRKRQHIDGLFKEYCCDAIDDYARISHALTLYDTFWVREEGSQLFWDDVSLYRNAFDITPALIAFEGRIYKVLVMRMSKILALVEGRRLVVM